jgi:PiT family inorganic phosphate transporter
METFYLIVLVVALALAFDFINGFHDTANAIATSVSTRALSPRNAIILASVMNLIGALMFTGVAKTIGGKVADPLQLEFGVYVVMATLLAAISWNLLTWWFGLPSSSSHALIGSLAGGVLASAGIAAINFNGFLTIVQALIFSPIIAFVIGFVIMMTIKIVLKNANPSKVNTRARYLQILSASFLAYTHGANDAQKTMGIIVFALVAGGYQDTLDVPLWVKISAAVAMALGTSVGGWKIIKTMGTKIFKIEPANGFAADLSSSIIIFCATLFKLPVSSTHAITSAILGVGSAKRFSSVNWGVAGRIVATWFITIPITAILAIVFYEIIAVILL